MKRFEAVATGPCVGGQVVLRLADGGEVQVSVPGPLREHFHPGVRTVLYYGPSGELLGWRLPDKEVGYDLRA